MASLTMNVHYRPLRVGLLVREGHLDDLALAFSINTILWGGIFNVIIPVGTSNAVAEELVRLCRVDVLQPVADSSELIDFFRLHKHLRWPMGFDQPHLFEVDGGKKRSRILDIVPALVDHWDREFKHSDTSPCYVVEWDESDPLASMLTGLFGKFPEDLGLRLDYKDAYLKSLKAETFRIEPSARVLPNLADKVTPLDFTRVRLDSDRGLVAPRYGVYVGDPSDFGDLVSFWNLRASGRWLGFLPTLQSDRLRDYLQTRLAKLIPSLERGHSFEHHAGLFYRSGLTLPPDVDAILPSRLPWYRTEIDNDFWGRYKPPLHRFERISALANLDVVKGSPPQLALALPGKPLPEGLARRRGRQQWVVSVSPLVDSGYQGHTLRPPFLPDMNEWLSRQIIWHPDGLRAEVESIGIISELHDETLDLRPIPIAELIAEICRRASIKATPSRPGHIARRLISQMGRIDGCRAFKIPGLRKLIVSKRARDGVTSSAAVEIIRDADPKTRVPSFSPHEHLYIEPRTSPLLTPHDVFDFLVKKRLLRTGLSLVCPNCTLDFWLAMENLRTLTRCEYCGHRILTASHLRHRGDWSFRLSGLFGREDRQEGAVPVILTLLQLFRCHDSSSEFLYDTANCLDGPGLSCEVDLIVVERGRNGGTRVLIGECKTANPIEEEDIHKLSLARELLQKSAITVYLLFSKTAPTFTPEEIALFRAVRSGGAPVILFTSQELEKYYPYEDMPKDVRLPHPHALSFSDLAENSDFLYLGTSPGGAR